MKRRKTLKTSFKFDLEWPDRKISLYRQKEVITEYDPTETLPSLPVPKLSLMALLHLYL